MVNFVLIKIQVPIRGTSSWKEQDKTQQDTTENRKKLRAQPQEAQSAPSIQLNPFLAEIRLLAS